MFWSLNLYDRTGSLNYCLVNFSTFLVLQRSMQLFIYQNVVKKKTEEGILNRVKYRLYQKSRSIWLNKWFCFF